MGEESSECCGPGDAAERLALDAAWGGFYTRKMLLPPFFRGVDPNCMRHVDGPYAGRMPAYAVSAGRFAVRLAR